MEQQPRPGPYAPPSWQAAPAGANPYAGPPGPAGTGPHAGAGGAQPPRPAPPAPAPGPPRRRRSAVLLASGLALALALGGGWFLLGFGGSTEEDSAPSEHSHRENAAMAWQADAPEVRTDGYFAADTRGTWFTPRTVVKAGVDEIRAYDRRTGAPRGTIRLPGEICGNRPGPVDGTVALAHTSRGDVCDRYTLVDLGTWKKRWTRRLPAAHADGTDVEWVVQARVGDTLYVAFDDRLTARRASDGRVLWTRKAPEGWNWGYLAGGDRLHATLIEEHGGSAPAEKVRRLDTGSGKPLWSWSVPAGHRVTVFASTEPLLLGLATPDDRVTTSLAALDDEGRQRSRISLLKSRERDDDGTPNLNYMPFCGTSADGCAALAVTDDVVCLASEDARSDDDGDWEENRIVAHDLDSGRVVWSKAVAPKRSGVPFAVDGGNVIAYAEPTAESGGRLVRLDPRTGKRSTYQRHPDRDSENERDAYGVGTPRRLYLDRGQFFVATESMSEGEEHILTAYE